MSQSFEKYENEDFVESAREQVHEQKMDEREEDVDRAEALEAKQRLEQRTEINTEVVKVDVGGETIKVNTLDGLGEKTHLARRMIEAERKEDNQEQLIVLDDMIQKLSDKTVHDDIFDREFWNRRGDDQIQDAYEQLGLKSRGGPDAGN